MKIGIVSIIGALLVLPALVRPVQAVDVAVEFENLAPHGGVVLSPIWVGFNGQQFTLSATSPSNGLKQLAATGDASLLRQEFRTAAPDGVDGIIAALAGSPNAPNFAPGTTGTGTFTVDPATDRFMTFAGKVYPLSNSLVVGTTPLEVFDAQGNFKGKQIVTILGRDIIHAAAGSTAGTASISDGKSRIRTTGATTLADAGLAGMKFDSVASDCTLPNAAVARITVVPEPATIFLLAGGSLILLRRRKSILR